MKSTIFPGLDGFTFGRNLACGSKLHHFPAETKAGSSVRWYTELKPIPKRPVFPPLEDSFFRESPIRWIDLHGPHARTHARASGRMYVKTWCQYRIAAPSRAGAGHEAETAGEVIQTAFSSKSGGWRWTRTGQQHGFSGHYTHTYP